MSDITPVAWERSGWFFRNQYNNERQPLYTEAQLRAAQVQVLREAAEKFKHDCDCGAPCDCYSPVSAKYQLLDIAKELEAGK